jgi:hypothetical protein
MHFQAVRLRVQGWIMRLGVEVERMLADDREREYAREIEILSKRVAKLEQQHKHDTTVQTQMERELTAVQDTSKEINSALAAREEALRLREQKLVSFLALYELTTSKLDAMSLSPQSCDLFRGVLDAATAGLNASRTPSDGQKLGMDTIVPGAPATPPKQIKAAQHSPHPSPLAVVTSNEVSVDMEPLRCSPAGSSTVPSDVVMIEMDADDATHSEGPVQGNSTRDHRRAERAPQSRAEAGLGAPQARRSEMNSQYEQLRRMQQDMHRDGRSGRTPVKEERSGKPRRSPSERGGRPSASEVEEASRLLHQLRVGLQIE